jgi:hypothetical protein
MTLLPRTGAPLRAMTAKQIAYEQKLFLETGYNITHRARILKVNRSTLEYHLRPVSGNKCRVPVRVQELIEAGEALLAHLPKDETGWTLRLRWTQAKQAATNRKNQPSPHDENPVTPPCP